MKTNNHMHEPLKKKVLISSILIMLLLLGYRANSQNITDTSYFVDQNRRYEEKDTTFVLSMMNEFCVYRKFMPNGTFLESNLFGNNLYWIKKRKWYRFINNKWELFFDKKNFFRKIIYFDNYFFKLVPGKVLLQEKHTLYLFYIVKFNKSRLDINKYNYVLFSIDDGIVKIVNESIALKRVYKRPFIFNKCN